MNVLANIRVPEQVYRFYQKASRHVANASAEDIMADALSAYARLLSNFDSDFDAPHTEAFDNHSG